MSDNFSFQCSSCHDCTISISMKYIGKKGKCPKCKAIVIVPSPSKASTFSFTCSSCHYTASVPMKYAGQKGQCPKCKQALIISPSNSSHTTEKSQVATKEINPVRFDKINDSKTKNNQLESHSIPSRAKVPKSKRKNRAEPIYVKKNNLVEEKKSDVIQSHGIKKRASRIKRNTRGKSSSNRLKKRSGKKSSLNISLENKKSVHEIISTSFKILFSPQIIPIMQIFLILWIPSLFIQMTINPIKQPNLSIVLNCIVFFLFLPICMGAATKMIADIYQKNVISVSDSIKKGLSKYMYLIGSILIGILVLIGGILLLIVIFSLFKKMQHLFEVKIFIIMILAVVVVFVWYGFRFVNSLIVIVSVIIMEEVNPMEGFRRSIQLTKNYLFRASYIFFMQSVIIALPILIAALFIGSQRLKVEPPFILSVITFMSSAAGSMFFSIATVVYYFDLRVRKENFGLENLAKMFD